MEMDERELERVAKRLGRVAVERLDVERTAQAVVARLRVEPVPVVWWRRTRVLQATAAAAMILLTVGVLVRGQTDRDVITLLDVAVPVELQALEVDELEEVFDSLAVDGPVYELAVNLEDLTEGQLEELLRTMEG